MGRIVKKFILLLAFFCLVVGVYPEKSDAQVVQLWTYTYSAISSAGGTIVGYNKTKGYSLYLPVSLSGDGPSGGWTWTVSVSVPDDGCTWRLLGAVNYTTFSVYYVAVDTTLTTGGSFAGLSVADAYNAATTASSNTTYGGYSTGYWSYYANSNASTASSNASTAATNANTAATNALNAKTSADNAKTAADNAKASADTAATNASNSYNAVNNVNGNTVTAVRDATSTALAEARQSKTNALNAYNEAHTANTKIDSLQTSITTIQNNLGGDTTPPVPRLRTVSGAVATSGGSIQAVLDISDNISSTFTYSLDGTLYVPVPINKEISLPVTNFGPNVISAWVKDQAGNVGTTSITIRKI